MSCTKDEWDPRKVKQYHSLLFLSSTMVFEKYKEWKTLKGISCWLDVKASTAQPSATQSSDETGLEPIRMNEGPVKRKDRRPKNHFEEIFTYCHTTQPQITGSLTEVKDGKVNIARDPKHLVTFSNFFQSDVRWIITSPYLNNVSTRGRGNLHYSLLT